MNELINVEVNEKQQQVLSGRELHEFLEIGTRYNDWFNRMVEYGFTENIDYEAITQKRATAQGNETTYTDHAINIDMAKELSMIQRSEKGKQARLYFLELEKAWNTPESVMARALKMADTKMMEYKNNIIQLENKVEEQRPKVLFAEAVENSEDVILVKEMALILTQQGFKIGQNQLFEFLRENGFLCKKKGDMWHLPTKKYEHFFKVTKRTIQHTESTSVKNTPKITGKGQMYFIKRFAEYKALGLTVKQLLSKEEIIEVIHY